MKYVGTNVGTLTFNGLGGQDSVILTGSSADDRVEMWADRATLTSEYYTVVVTNVESITAIGNGGADLAILHDTAGDDTFVVHPDLAQFTGTGLSLASRGVRDGHRAGDGRRGGHRADVRLGRRGHVDQFADLGHDRRAPAISARPRASITSRPTRPPAATTRPTCTTRRATTP